MAVSGDYCDHFLDELGMGWAAKEGRRPRIDPGFSGISTGESKRTHAEPLSAQIILDRPHGETVLVHSIDDLQALPVVDVSNRVAEAIGDAGTISR